MEELSFEEQLKLLRKTTVYIGVHGSGMTNIGFLPKGSVVIELFPYGFERITYQTLARNVGVHYLKWKNSHRDKTIFHPEKLDSFPQLSKKEREDIINADQYYHHMPWAGNMYWIDQVWHEVVLFLTCGGHHSKCGRIGARSTEGTTDRTE